MGRISKEKKIIIQSLYHQKFAIREISRRLKISRKCVKTWIKRPLGEVKEKPRRVIKVSCRKLRAIKKDIAVPNSMSIRKASLKHKISSSSVYKLIRKSKENNNGLIPFKSVKKINVSALQQIKRVNFANELTKITNWHKKIVIYDEKPFELEKTPNKQNNRYWASNKQIADQYRVFRQDKHPTKVFCFASISWHGKSNIRWYVQERLNRNGMHDFIIIFIA
jgi:transposase